MSINHYDSSLSKYQYVSVDGFTPNSGQGWISFGNVTSTNYDPASKSFTIVGAGNPAPTLKIQILGPNVFRVWFNRSGNYARALNSYAVVNWKLGEATVNIVRDDASILAVDLGGIRLEVLKKPFQVRVIRNGTLISTDTAQGLEYVPGNDPTKAAVANFKAIPANAHYFGFGEKGGDQLDMIGTSMTFFNFDNYKYSGGAVKFDDGSTHEVIPNGSTPGPKNYAEPLYNSIPLLIEDNPNPVGGGVPYAYGLFFDNESQSYFNIGQSSPYAGDMFGKYYFGALFGDLDYYFMAGNDVTEVINLYTSLTGRPALPPMYALGYHQGCYGYYDQELVLQSIQNYRQAGIPIDGMHIDVDLQNNYRTFTASEMKFPGGGKPTFDGLKQLGVKASTNITGIVSMVQVDETGKITPYSVLNDGLAKGYFYTNRRVDLTKGTDEPLIVNESYGCNYNFNPFPTPGAPFDPGCQCGTPLGTYGHYADLGRPEVRTWWGTLYQPLLDAGLSMVWQDMTDPATQQSVHDTMPWKTLPLNLSVYDGTTDSMVPHAQVHNVFALNLISATCEGLEKTMPDNKRPFIIARGGYAGVQRYAASWTGDSASTWDFLAILIPEIINFGLSGQPMAGADVGGFAASETKSRADNVAEDELLVRWTTLSAFIGWFRNHYDGYNKAYQEPYAYKNQGVAQACKKYIEIRYKLLQLFYDLSYESSTNGLPICRPLSLTDRADGKSYLNCNQTTQFMVGNNLLVAPVIFPKTYSRNVYLPAGSQWYAYQDNNAPLPAPNAGGSTFNWYTPWDIVPLYVRAGAIIPRRELEQYVGELQEKGQSCHLTFDIYPGPAQTYRLYLDDKVSQAYKKDLYRLTEITQQRTAAGQTVRVNRIHDRFKPVETYYMVALLDAARPISATLNNVSLSFINAGSDIASEAALMAADKNAFYFNARLKTTFVKIFDTDPDVTLVVS